MGFSDRQINALRRNLNSDHVRIRKLNGGRQLPYIEGWHAVAEANRIFGFDGWDRETVEAKCVLSREGRGGVHAVYVVKVRVTVRAESTLIVREGHGTGEAQGEPLGEVHERALKMAETDATKRALATFGKPFGLSLYVSSRNRRNPLSAYGGTHGSTGSAAVQPPIPEEVRRRTQQQLGPNGRYYIPSRQPTEIDQVLTAGRPGASELANVTTGDSQRTAHRTTQAAPVEKAAGYGMETIAGTAPRLRGKAAVSSDRAENTTGQAAFGNSADMAVVNRQSEQRADEGDLLAGSSEERSASVADEPIATLHRPSSPQQPQAQADAANRVQEARLLIDWPKRHRNPAHLRFVMSQPCLFCARTPSDAHHLRFAQPRALGRKVSDEFTVPLCRTHHRQLHRYGNELAWWMAMDPHVDPLAIAKELWEQSHGTISGLRPSSSKPTGPDLSADR
jgi:hypothetical protein